MKLVRIVLMLIGALAALMGLVWIGQGTGVFPYPAQSYMIDQMPWAWRGIALAVGGLIVIFIARRL